MQWLWHNKGDTSAQGKKQINRRGSSSYISFHQLAAVLLPFQITRRRGFFKYIIFAMLLDIVYISVHIAKTRKVKTSYNLKWKD